MKKYGVIAFSIFVTGCLPMGRFDITQTDSPESFSVPTIVSGNCGAGPLQGLVGQNESALVGVELPEGTRIIRPGTAYTTDAVADRLNIGINGSGEIVHADCG